MKVNVQADVAEINSLYEKYLLAANTDDLDLFISLWDENAIRLEPDQPPIYGKEQIRAFFEMSFGQFRGEIEIYGDTEIKVGEEWAYAFGTYKLNLVPKTGGAITHIDGKWMDILKRQDDGSWKIFRDMLNYNAPPTQD